MPVSVDSLRDALSDPAAYAHAPDRVDLVQTHISLVAVVPPWVYKVKKPVNLGFLDFSTLDARRAACDAEVRLNRRLCAGVYRGVVPVVDTPDGLRVDPDAFDASGSASDAKASPVVDVAVKMRYLPPEGFLHHRVADGSVTPAAVDRVADTLCCFYRERQSTPEIADAGWIDRLRVNTDENFAQTADRVGHALPRPTYDALRHYTDAFYEQHAALLHRRRAHGHIVNGHGDLRLEHVHLCPPADDENASGASDEASASGDADASGDAERVCIYDCIEFNERFRHLDVASDVAFLAMDFDVHGRPDLGRRFVERVQTTLDDPDLLKVLPFYKAYRAYVRGKVEGMRAAEGEVPPRERSRSRMRARRFYRWALRYAVTGDAPMVVVLMGRSGTGKSTQAAAVADGLGWTHLSSDRIRKTRAGVPLHVRPDAETRSRLYAAAMSEAVYATLRQRAVEHLRRYESVVLDATYSARAERDRLRDALRAVDARYAFVELTAPDAVLRERLSQRDDHRTVSDARQEDFDVLTARYQTPDALEDARHVRVSAVGDVDATTTDVLTTLMQLNGE